MSISQDILTLDLEEDDDLSELELSLRKQIFDCSLEVKKLLQSHSHEPIPVSPPLGEQGGEATKA